MAPARLGLIAAITLLSACVWRTSDPGSAPSSVLDSDAPPVETVAKGITRQVVQGENGDEIVKINVNTDEVEMEEPPEAWPRPFEPEQIRDGLALDTRLTFHMTGAQAGDAWVEWLVTDHSETAVTITYQTRLPPGAGDEEAPADSQSETYSWATLADHANFPKDKSERTEGAITVQAGTFDATVFTLKNDEATPPVVETFYFAKDLPGPPVLHVVMSGDSVLHRMELTADSRQTATSGG